MSTPPDDTDAAPAAAPEAPAAEAGAAAPSEAPPRLPPELTEGPTLPLVELLAAALVARGVRFAFGMPGGDVLSLIDALERHGVRFILSRHEASAGAMADAAFQRTGAPGLCVATLGPGALQLLTGVAGAGLERSAVVAITGAPPMESRPQYTHQVIDQVALYQPVTRRSVALTEESGFLQVLTALAGLDRERPGPVHLDLPSDVADRPQPAGLGSWLRRRSPRPVGPDEEALRAATTMIAAARRPVVLVGLGAVAPAAREAAAVGIEAWAEAAGAPVLTTFRAKGALPEDHPLSAGAFGLSPVADALQQRLIAQADLIVAVGLDPVELRSAWSPGWPARTPVLSLDPWGQPELQGAVTHLTGPIDALLDALHPPRASAWTKGELAAHRAALDARFTDGDDGPATTVRAVQAGCPAGVLAAVDVGAHRITLSHTWVCGAPGELLQSNGLCAMATALPMAIAMKLHEPGRPVLAVAGDGGLLMGLGELSLAAELGLDLVVVVFVDRSLSLIALKQERLTDPLGRPVRTARVGLRAPDFVGLTEALGGTGRRARGAAEVEAAVRAAFAAGGLQLVAVEIDPAPYRAQM